MSSSRFGISSTAEQVTEGRDLSGTTWLITGCNSGLGHETARVLALRGAHIIGAARTQERAEKALSALGVEGTPVACELSDLASVRAAVAALQGRRLDGIIANAGIMALPELHQSHGVELQFLTNHVGHSALVDGLVDQLVDNGRVVILSSAAHFMAKDRGLELDNVSGETDYHPWRLYGRSKLANLVYAAELARRFQSEGSGRRANAVHPGVIRTNLSRHVADEDRLFSRMPHLKTIAEGAATQCYVATHPDIEAHSGRYFEDCDVAESLDAGDAEIDALRAVTDAILARIG
jgi:WW domain-containing oxidoreductase